MTRRRRQCSGPHAAASAGVPVEAVQVEAMVVAVVVAMEVALEAVMERRAQATALACVPHACSVLASVAHRASLASS